MTSQTEVTSTTAHGLLAIGTVTPHGTIAGRSYTAYKMKSGEYVAFSTVHGPYAAVEPLVVLG